MPRRSQTELERLSTQAFELLDSGLTQSEIAEFLGVSLRTVQRWIAARSSNKKPSSEQQVTEVLDTKPITKVKQSSNQIPVKTPIEERIDLATYLKGLINFSEHAKDWSKLVDITLETHYVIHSEIAENLHLKLIDELAKPDASIRNINLLSLTLVRHLDNVQKNLFLGNETPMNLSKAMLLIHAYGKAVIDMEAFNQACEQ